MRISDLDTIISVGIAGPTARNLQKRHFIFGQNTELLQQINDGVRILMINEITRALEH